MKIVFSALGKFQYEFFRPPREAITRDLLLYTYLGKLEVWRGLGVWPESNVWCLVVTLYFVLKSLVLLLTALGGAWACDESYIWCLGQHPGWFTEAWCIAKIKRLVVPMEPPVKPDYVDEIKIADYLEAESFQTPEMTERRKFITVGTIR